MKEKNKFEELYSQCSNDIPWMSEDGIDTELDYFYKRYGFGKGKCFFDVGCGYTSIGLEIKRNEQTYLGIDISESIIQRNIQRYQSHQGILSYQVADIRTFTPDHIFDVILDIGCLHCIQSEYHEAILKKYVSLLRLDGYICLRSFDNDVPNQPLFSEQDVPIWGVNPDLVHKIQDTCNLYLLEKIIDEKSFDITKRTTYIFRKTGSK